MFTGVRFVVEDEATLMFSSANATEFNGVYNFVSQFHVSMYVHYTSMVVAVHGSYAFRVI